MNLPGKVAALALAATVTLSFAGCEKSRSELQPDMDRVVDGDHGPQCANIREMASKLAPDMLGCKEIVGNPNRAVIVMMNVENKTQDQKGEDFDIWLAMLAGDLKSVWASDRVAFVENQAKLNQMISQELGGNNPDPTEDAPRTGQPTGGPMRRLPQYFLHGTVYSKNNGKTTFYYFEFNLTKPNGDIVWTGPYQVRTLN